MPTGQSRTELAERVGFDCADIVLIQKGHGARRRAPCRHHFRHDSTATIERMRRGVVLRGLRGRPPPYPHECDFHSNSRV